MSNSDSKVIALARKIAELMLNTGNRTDAMDAHDMARTFYRRRSLTDPQRPVGDLHTPGRPQSKKRVLSASA
jgi:hypothetical protein